MLIRNYTERERERDKVKIAEGMRKDLKKVKSLFKMWRGKY